jgi:hypothetical protein
MGPFNICAVYGEPRSMRSTLIYAGKLAKKLGSNPLHVYLPGVASAHPAPVLTNGSARETQQVRVAERVKAWQPADVLVHDAVDLRTVRATELPANAIVVSNNLALRRRDLTILQPFEERDVLRSEGGILVPFGDGNSGPASISFAIPLAKALSREIVFYHTTWRNEKVASNNAVDHLCAAAESQHELLKRQADQAGVAHRMAVEMADDVVFGMLNCALNGDVRPDNPNPVNLIVMAHGVKTYKGSYARKALKESPTPLLVVGRSTEGGVA